MTTTSYQELTKLLDFIKGLSCWYVSCGAVGATFQLALGNKIPRRRPLRNPDHPEDYRRFEGEANLLVWCSWRLDEPHAPLTSSDDTMQPIESGLSKLIGAKVVSYELTIPGWDLNTTFSTGLLLRIFCDHVPGEPSYSTNWELWRKDSSILVGPGATYTIEAQRTDETGEKGGDAAECH